MSWREADPFGHSVPWLIGERGLPSMSTSSPSRVYTTWPQPTAQYGQIDSVAFSPAIRAPAFFVLLETAIGPMPQSAARPTTGRSRTRLKDFGRIYTSWTWNRLVVPGRPDGSPAVIPTRSPGLTQPNSTTRRADAAISSSVVSQRRIDAACTPHMSPHRRTVSRPG